jgi:hypothetical protein
MSRRRFLLLALLASAAGAEVCAPARAGIFAKAGHPATGCLYGTAQIDGCAGAQARGSFKQSDLYIVSVSAGQTWTSHHPPPFNVPGIDYPVGYDTALTLKDPKNDAGLLPTGCIYEAVGTQNSGPEVLCDRVGGVNAVSPTFIGWDFSGAIGGEGCVWVHHTTRSSGTFTFLNNKFQANGACVVNNGSLMSFEVGTVGDFIFMFNEVDGNFPTVSPGSGQMGTMISHGNVGSATIKYNYIHDVPVRPFGGTNTDAAVVGQFNVINGYGLQSTGLHGALDEILMPAGSTLGSVQWSYNLSIYPAAAASGNTTAFSFLSAHTPTPWGGVQYASIQLDHNISVTNPQPGGGSVVSQALSYIQYFKKVGTVTIQDNWVDPSGALGCSDNLGGAFSMTGFIDNNGGGSAGTTLNVTSIPNGGVWPGAVFHIITGDGAFTDATVLPYGTVCDGAASTGTGDVGTYCLSGSAQGKRTFSNGQTQNTPIDTLNYGGSGHDNINLRDGSTVTIAGTQWTSGQCNGHL